MAFFQSDEQRDILALSFEPSGSGYLYYHYRRFGGVPVTSEERESYLRIAVCESRQAWRESLAGKETFPPRNYGPAQRKLLAAMPFKMAFSATGLGIIGVVSGSNEADAVFAVAYLAGGLALAVFGVSIIVARFAR